MSPAAAQPPGITDTTIKLGTQAPMSGLVALIGMVAEGQKRKFDAINAAGGVKMGDGKTRQVELVIMDDANEPPRTVTNARRMAEQTRVFAFVGSVGTPQNQAIKAYVRSTRSRISSSIPASTNGAMSSRTRGGRHGAVVHDRVGDLRASTWKSISPKPKSRSCI